MNANGEWNRMGKRFFDNDGIQQVDWNEKQMNVNEMRKNAHISRGMESTIYAHFRVKRLMHTYVYA